jgi:hypothetical protein
MMEPQLLPVFFCFSLCFCGSFCPGCLFCLRSNGQKKAHLEERAKSNNVIV